MTPGMEAETLEAPEAPPPAPVVKERVAKYMVIDTETSDLPNFKLPADAPGQARLAELAMILLDEDLELVEPARQIYIKPDGWSMQPGATAVNKLTDEFLNKFGEPIGKAIDIYTREIEGGCIVVAHHAQFDTKIMRGELRRAGRNDLFEKTKQTCTMRSMQQWLKSQGRPAKWVKLTQAAAESGSEALETHSALDDAWLAVHVFRFLMRNDSMISPQVHHGFGSVGGVDRRAAEE